MGIRLDEPLRKAVGDRTAKVLHTGLGLDTVGDLLRHYPRKYVKRGELTELSELEPGTEATIVAQVTKVSRRSMAARRGQMMTVEVRDAADTAVEITFFNPRAANALKPGMLGMFAGKVGEYHGKIQLTNPEFAKLDADTEDAGDSPIDNWAGELMPLYPSTGGLPSWKIARCVRMVIDQLDADIEDDPMPRPVRARQGLLTLTEAFRRIHRPDDWPEIAVARKRLKWDEALPMQVVLAQRREALKALPAVPRRRVPGGLLDAFDAALPFTLTAGQRQVGEEIEADLASEHPMHRLLQGDVGSGKTMVALRAMLAVVDAGGQAVMLAPTEVLAQQHHRSIVQMLGAGADVPMDLFSETAAPDAAPFDPNRKRVRVALLTGSQNAKDRRTNLLDAASGTAGIVIGTHAVIQDHVQFADLGLVVVDEQHRFGVEQRDALRAKGEDPPHVLVMTATPIPRTVAMTVFGDLETSVLSELPAGRSPIATHVVAAHEHPSHFTRVWERIREEVGAGRQAYVVCPRIGEESGSGEVSDDGSELVSEPGQQRPPLAVVDVAAKLAEGPLKGLRVGMLHGRMAPDDKDAVMRAYAGHELDVLVATTVIEVGVNVPNSTVIVVMDADRFGVSQLHQLRGRVGRGKWPGLCLLVTESPDGAPARERLAAVASTLDGFELSKIDLAIRKEGDVLGATQSGYRSSLRMLSVIDDEDIIRAARDEATPLVEADPALNAYPALARTIAVLLDPERAEYLGKT
ncbi:ATP-dependent DNA helicase RecG [Catenulispora acidiphila DSM 44928]|uniref:Probable DNA 3'-5' helicase RecG n=1 Tax=Catenulispora acidiphila (strain DSM 44928 / JCM 14897 / NBRC 102108 / NRRL B-24433 / ID139908) TaxID=479433 RepID=C7QGZ8_CATAD|nr:ATP-dependent DNA helicase RecG [Catenulispora acidiphila]ACU76848.1 ATP-dependent DNA helicase RecG [Catenulispora acidiphila DSM 44928]